MSRVQVANYLRAIRAVGVERAGELFDWVVAMLPESPPVQRLAVRAFIARGDLEAAEVIVARQLRRQPGSASWRLLAAQCHAARTDWGMAMVDLDMVVEARPQHRTSRRFAALVAERLNRFGRVVELLEPIASDGDSEVVIRLTNALLHCGEVERAEETLDGMHQAPVTLQAAVLHARGRFLDAAECLYSSLRLDGPVEDGHLAMTLEAVERIGDRERLTELVSHARAEHAASQLFIARLHLSQGRFRHAVLLAARHINHEGQSQVRDALATLVVAAAMLRRERLARRAISRLRRCVGGIDPQVMAERWHRAMLGDLLCAQCSPEAPVRADSVSRPSAYCRAA